MLCAGCDGGQHTVDQRSAAGCCAGCLPCFEDGCSRHHLPAEKCGRRCSSTDASTWQDGLVAILRNALCKDTGRKYRPLSSLLLFSLAKSLTRLEELRDERNLRPKIGSPTPPNCPLAERCTDASSSLGCTHMSRSGAGQDHGSQRCSTRPSNSGGSSAARRRRVGGAGQDPAHRGAATEAGCGRFMWRGERTGARSHHHQGPRISFEFHDQSILFTSADGAVSSTTSGRST